MSKSPLVKIGVRPQEAEAIRNERQIRLFLEQGDAAIARIRQATLQKIREYVEKMAQDPAPVIPFEPASGE